MEAVLHEREIAALDEIKTRFGLPSRSDAIRVLIARTDVGTLTAADTEALKEGAR